MTIEKDKDAALMSTVERERMRRRAKPMQSVRRDRVKELDAPIGAGLTPETENAPSADAGISANAKSGRPRNPGRKNTAQEKKAPQEKKNTTEKKTEKKAEKKTEKKTAEKKPAEKKPERAAKSAPEKKSPAKNEKKSRARKSAAQESAEIIEKPARTRAPGGRKNARQEKNAPPVRVYFLGGLNEIGKNMTLYECGGDMFIVDCGLAFPDDDMPGVDLVIPDFTFVEQNRDKIRGILITHGHEDHIGSLPFLLKKVNAPVYGTRLTLGLVEGKLREHGLLNSVKLCVTSPGTKIPLGCMSAEMIRVNHSIPDAVAFAITTPAGVIIQTGDFKIDCTPIQGEMIDLARFAQYGQEGVLALLSDSTNAERPGYTKSERSVGESFDVLFKRAEHRRIIIATFASNIQRVQQIIDAAERYGRKVALSGRSMVNVANVAYNLGYLRIPDGLLVDLDQINHYPKEKVVLITTGSQGEPMSALTRMAFSDHRQVNVGPEDFIIISATPIPGNEKTVGKVVDELLKLGCEVVYERMYEVHVSGHACQEELKLMMGIVKPKFFVPVHGEQKHLQKNVGLAKSMGIPADHIFTPDIGRVVEFTADTMKSAGTVPAGRVMVDGLGVGDVGSVVLRDRKHLAEDGLIVIVLTVDLMDGQVLSGPDVISRGFVYVRENEPLMEDVKRLVQATVEDCMKGSRRDWNSARTRVKESVSRLLFEKTKRNPMVIPVIMEV